MCKQTNVEAKLNFTMGIFLCSLNLTRITAAQINDKAIPNSSMDNYGISLLLRIYSTAESIRKLLPLDINDEDVYMYHSSIISLSRNLIDCSVILFYLCFDIDDTNTKKLRFSYMDLFGIKYEFDTFNMIEYEEKASAFLEKFKEDKKLIFSNPIFSGLSSDEKKDFEKCLKNNYKFYGYKEKDNILTEMKYFDVSEIKFAYSTFSSFVHSFPSSFYENGLKEKLEWSIEMISYALTISSSVLVHSTRNFINNTIKKNRYIYEQFCDLEKTWLKEIILQLNSLIEIIKSEEWGYKRLKLDAKKLWEKNKCEENK